MTEQTIPALAKLDPAKRDEYLKNARDYDESGLELTSSDNIDDETVKMFVDELSNAEYLVPAIDGMRVAAYLEIDPTDDWAALSVVIGETSWPTVVNLGQKIRYWVGDDLSSWTAVADHIAAEVVDHCNEVFVRTVEMSRELAARFPA